MLERLRIPLIFSAPGLPPLENAGALWASQVDVLPTVLGLMAGDHPYSGMGRNLLDRGEPFTGVVSGTRDTGYYLTENWILQYHPFDWDTRLFTVTNAAATTLDMAGEKPEELKRLRQEYFARVELARRLSLAKQVFPFNPDQWQTISSAPVKTNSPVRVSAR